MPVTYAARLPSLLRAYCTASSLSYNSTRLQDLVSPASWHSLRALCAGVLCQTGSRLSMQLAPILLVPSLCNEATPTV